MLWFGYQSYVSFLLAKGCSLNSFTTFMDLESVGLATSPNSRALRRLMRKAYSESEDISWAARNKRPYRKMRTQMVHVKKFPDYLRNALQSENTESHPWLSSRWQDMPWGWEISTVRVDAQFLWALSTRTVEISQPQGMSCQRELSQGWLSVFSLCKAFLR